MRHGYTHYRQAEKLRHRQAGNTTRCRAPPAQGPEQSRRADAPADPAEGTPGASLQVGWPGTTVPVSSRKNQQPAPNPPSSQDC